MSNQATIKHLWKHMWKSTDEQRTEAEEKLASIENNILTSLEELYKVANTEVPDEISSTKKED